MNNLADVVTLRAVRLDAELIASIRALLKPTGRLVTFGLPAELRDFALTQQLKLRTPIPSCRFSR